MSKHKTTPAERVIAAFGGSISEVAKVVGRHPSSVCRWRYEYGAAGGTDGYVPANLQGTILRAARKRGLDLTAEDLIGD